MRARGVLLSAGQAVCGPPGCAACRRSIATDHGARAGRTGATACSVAWLCVCGRTAVHVAAAGAAVALAEVLQIADASARQSLLRKSTTERRLWHACCSTVSPLQGGRGCMTMIWRSRTHKRTRERAAVRIASLRVVAEVDPAALSFVRSSNVSRSWLLVRGHGCAAGGRGSWPRPRPRPWQGTTRLT